MSMHDVWRTLRRPFRYVSCVEHSWQVYDFDSAGCLKCGTAHRCATNALDCRCPLAVCDDMRRVCTITGLELPEVHHGSEEYLDTCVSGQDQPEALASLTDLECEVERTVHRLLLGPQARRYREEENARQACKIATALHKALRAGKLKGSASPPNVCQFLAEAMGQERNLRFVGTASGELAGQCVRQILACLVDLRAKGVKFAQGPRLDGLVCGLLYLLRTGLTYRSHVLLGSIEEIAGCLPHENKLEAYFGISSKVLTEVENESKLVYRAFYQD